MKGVMDDYRLSVLVLGFYLVIGLFGANSVALADVTVNVKTDLGPLGCPDGNAVGDGDANDTMPIRWALNYVISQGGGTVYCPAGTYKVINLEVYDGADLAGAGRELTHLRPHPDKTTNALLYLKGGSMRNFTAYGSYPDDSGENWRCGRHEHSGPANVIKAQPITNGALLKGVRTTEGRHFTFYTRGTKGLWVVDCEFDRGETIVAMDAKEGADEEFVFANCVFGPWRDKYLFDIEPLSSDNVRNGIILNCKFIGADSGDYSTNTNLWGCFLGFKGYDTAGERKNVAVVGCNFYDSYIYINKVFPDNQFSCNRIDGDYPIFARPSYATVGAFPDTIVQGNYFVGKKDWSQIACGVDFSGSSTFRCNTPPFANDGPCSWPECNETDLALLGSVSNIEELSFDELMRLCTNCPREVLEHFYDGCEDCTITAGLHEVKAMMDNWLMTTPVEPDSTGLVGWWELDGNANDSSVNANHGSVVGSASYVTGKFDQAINLDGDGDYVQIGGDESDYDIADEITVSAWIKMTTPSYEGYNKTRNIVSKGDSAWKLYMWSDTRVKFHCSGLSCGDEYAMGGVDVTDRLWHHVAGVYDGSYLYIYIDGVMEDSLAASGSISTNDYNVCIGENLEVSNEWIDLIDDVRIYDYALPEEEITYLADLRLPSLKNQNMKNALMNKIDAVLGMVDQGNYNGALSKLEHDILQKTNGCAENGQPDKNDWIRTCQEQSQIYPLVTETIEQLRSLSE